MKCLARKFLLASALTYASLAIGANGLTDEEIRQLIVRQSIAASPGNCPCPFNVDRAGRSCGRRSAWSRAGGYSPICYTNEVTEEQISAYRKLNGT